METSREEMPSWWKRHYLPEDIPQGKFNSPFYRHTYGSQTARFYPTAQDIQSSNPEFVGMPVRLAKVPKLKFPSNNGDADEMKLLQRMQQYKYIVSRMRENDSLAKRYTGETFHSMELMHPNFWFSQPAPEDDFEDDVTNLSSSEMDSFWVNKHLYMKTSDTKKPKYGKDELLTVRLAREAKDMNSKMSTLYDSEKLKLLEMESQLELNKGKIHTLERELSKAEETSRIFEKTFTEANKSILKKLETTHSKMKSINSTLFKNSAPTYSYPRMLPALALPDQKALIRNATDPIWERTRLFLENEQDKDRIEQLERAYSNTFR